MRRITLTFLTFTLSIFAQINIEKVRDRIAVINIGYLNSQLSVNQINELGKLLNSVTNDDINLKPTVEKLNDFKVLMKNENNFDSLKKAFRSVNNQFNMDAGMYLYEALLKSNKRKIIVLSTSMSCECTLDMCYWQEAEVQKVCKENDYDYAVIDTWTNSDIQVEYQAGFVPTVILLDSNNSELKRFVREEYLIEKINGSKL